MANSVDPDQTAPIGEVCSGSTLFACILKFASNVRQLFAADDFSRRHFQMHFSWRFNLEQKEKSGPDLGPNCLVCRCSSRKAAVNTRQIIK